MELSNSGILVKIRFGRTYWTISIDGDSSPYGQREKNIGLENRFSGWQTSVPQSNLSSMMSPTAFSLLALIAHLNDVGWLKETKDIVRNAILRQSQANFPPNSPCGMLRVRFECNTIFRIFRDLEDRQYHST